MLALALTGGGAFLSGNNLLFLLFAAMMAILMVSAFIGRLSLAGLELELVLPKHVSAREATPASIRIRNLKRLSASFSIELSGLDSFLQTPVYFPVIPGRGTAETAVTVVFPKRGLHRENLFRLTTRFPFGFIRRSARVKLRYETLVFPSVLPPEGLDKLPERLSAEADAMRRGPGHDFHQIRPYEMNDDSRHTDWKGTARTGEVQVREFGLDERKPVELWLDLRINPGQEERFEWLVDCCAFVSWELTRQGVEVRMRTSGTDEERTDIYDILELLSLTEPRPFAGASESDFALGQDPESGSLVIFSTRRPGTGGVAAAEGHMMIAQELLK